MSLHTAHVRPLLEPSFGLLVQDKDGAARESSMKGCEDENLCVKI